MFHPHNFSIKIGNKKHVLEQLSTLCYDKKAKLIFGPHQKHLTDQHGNVIKSLRGKPFLFLFESVSTG